MPVPPAAGHPQLSGGVIPSSVRAGKILMNFYLATVLGAICNTDYEGDIKSMGDKVEIVGEPDIIVKDYEKGMKLEYDALNPPVQYLEIDQAKYWAHTIDCIDKFQSDHDYLNNWSVVAGKLIKIEIDATVLAGVYSQAKVGNFGATAGAKSGNINLGATGAPRSLTSATILKFIAQMGQCLTEQDVPDEDRCLVIPAWATTLIKTSEFKDASVSGDNTSSLRNGRLGIIDGFTIYQSNNIASVQDGANLAFEVIACHKSAISFAGQIDKQETLVAQDTFGDLARGLMVFGYKVVKPEGLVHAHVYEG